MHAQVITVAIAAAAEPNLGEALEFGSAIGDGALSQWHGWEHAHGSAYTCTFTATACTHMCAQTRDCISLALLWSCTLIPHIALHICIAWSLLFRCCEITPLREFCMYPSKFLPVDLN